MEEAPGWVIKHSVCLWKAHVTQLGNVYQMIEKLSIYIHTRTHTGVKSRSKCQILGETSQA